MTQHFNGISNCQAGIIRRKFEAIALLPAMVADLRLYAFATFLRHGILHKYLIHMRRKELQSDCRDQIGLFTLL